METVWDIPVTKYGLVIVADKKPNDNGYSEFDAYQTIIWLKMRIWTYF